MSLDARLATALKQFQMWHQKAPKRIKPRRQFWPNFVIPSARAVEILYLSDKWEADKDFHPYSHDFESHPTVYQTPRNDGARHNPGNGKNTAQLLGFESLTATNTGPILAYVSELTVDVDGEERCLRFKHHPVMTCSADRKTLVILDRRTPILIRGGSMVVTERGIVN